ncbi:MAG TPA: hypothetical protein VHY33_14565 [Thermoanaerobaculia bacterium]|nr:hypothetical protein [Thermoanaerobaculia bacterium]
MKKQLFDELVESINEAGRIHRGEIRPSREFIFDEQDVPRTAPPDVAEPSE